MSTRRRFLQQAVALAGAGTFAVNLKSRAATPGAARRFHLSVSIDALNADPELLDIVRGAGVSDLWLACFFQGQWHHTIEEYVAWRDRIAAAGMETHQITIPLGHPSFDAKPPDYMPGVNVSRWKPGFRPDGKQYWGVSLHPPITEENVTALREIKKGQPGIVFVDDDFRLAPSPADIGGCFCDAHRDAFPRKHGYSPAQWDELLDAVKRRDLTPLVRDWVTDTCDELTASFRAQQEALAPEAELGIMVMYLGSEKAGIRLPDYTGVPFRVGELMFNDKSFDPVKGKTDELFSALFHRRFTPPERAYSETTAWPPDQLSAPNMAAKLVISTIADVCNTMFMSGNTPFPRTHWETLAPAMREQAKLHAKLAGHVPRGPLKHYWGEHSRWVGDSNPYSLFLACGIPFEVTETPAPAVAGSPDPATAPTEGLLSGWTFLSDADARAASAGKLASAGTQFIHRPGVEIPGGRAIAETLENLFRLKHELLPQLKNIPYVQEDTPIVCAWYPEARSVLLWDLSGREQAVTVRRGDTSYNVSVAPLDAGLVEGI